MQSSQLGLLPDLESRTYSYRSSHLETCCWVSVLNSSCRAATVLAVTAIHLKTSGSFACRIQSSELGLLPELGPHNHSYCSSHPEDLLGL
eukprot:6555146-Pyramimonas_sp.AAC.1